MSAATCAPILSAGISPRLPCCAAEQLEKGMSGRCAYRASLGHCTTVAFVFDSCPISCGRCIRCVGLCGPAGAAARRAAEANGSHSVLDNAWCATYPRCAIFGCCESQFPFCHRPSDREFGRPPSALVGANLSALAGHPRMRRRQTRRGLERGLARLPFTTPAQYEQLAAREEFRVLYAAHGPALSRLPREYSLFAQPHSSRHFIFLSFHRNESVARASIKCTTLVCERFQVQGTIHFPNSTVNEGRNLLYLAAREQEIRQGWLYDCTRIQARAPTLFHRAPAAAPPPCS